MSDESKELYAEAKALVCKQREHRGWHKGKDLEGKRCDLPNPYKPTAETEARARRIVALRRKAAKCE